LKTLHFNYFCSDLQKLFSTYQGVLLFLYLVNNKTFLGFKSYIFCIIETLQCSENKTNPFFFFFFCLFVFLGLYPQHIEVPRLRVKSELQLQAYISATATQDLSHIYDLHHSSQQHQILNPLSKARD